VGGKLRIAPCAPAWNESTTCEEGKFFIDNLLARNHFIIVMIRWIGLAPWGFEFPIPRSLTFKGGVGKLRIAPRAPAWKESTTC